MLIAETLALVALDPITGETRGKLSKAHSQTALACGLLIELATQMRLGLHDGVVVILDNLPSRHPLLTACLKLAKKYSGLLNAEQLMLKVSAELPRLRNDLLDALYRRDILHAPKRKLWLFGTKRYLIRSTQAQNEGLDAIKKCANGENSKLAGIALLGLACATGVIDHLLTHEDAEDAKARLRLLHQEISIQLDMQNDDVGELHSIALMEHLYQILSARMR